MSLTCPAGHPSDETDYCSVCGVLMAGTPAVSSTAPPPPPPAPDVAADAKPCPHCGSEIDPDTRFCEVCGYDPTTGSLPEAPVAVPADLSDPGDPGGDATAAPADAAAVPGDAAADASVDQPDVAVTSGDASADAASAVQPDAVAAGAPAPVTTGTWVAVVTADRPYYDRNQVDEVQFPLGVPPRTITLTAGSPQAIGRRSRSRGTSPEIDLAGPPEDAAVSHTHATLLPTGSGGWELVDHGSTNGTYLNESPHPIGANEPVALSPGDRIYVGAWTKITLEQHP
jgi:FHA domain-containing protein/zinc ribbon protein